VDKIAASHSTCPAGPRRARVDGSRDNAPPIVTRSVGCNAN
jgi:hypothetical protein